VNANGSDRIRLEVGDSVAYVTLNAPPVNILTAAMMRDLADVVQRVQADPTLKAIAVTAEGRAFSAGADVGERAGRWHDRRVQPAV